MALSQTSLDIDLLTIATLYNRGLLVSSSKAYVPIVSSIGAFSKWTNQAIDSIFNPILNNYSSGIIFEQAISSLQQTYNQTSSSLYLNTSNLSSFTFATYSTLNAYSNIPVSTVSGLQNTYTANSTIVYNTYSSVSHNYSTLYSGVSTTVDGFYDTLFSPNASTLIEIGINKYIPRERAGEFTYNAILNPNPLLGGDFASTIPLAWYWTGLPSGYIGPGLSSISTVFNDVNGLFYTNINTNFPNALSSISTGWGYSNSSLYEYRSSINATVSNAPSYIDGGSSISTLYTDIQSTFISTLNYASTFGNEVSTISSFLISTIDNTRIPTFDGFSISQFISTGNTGINIDQRALNIRLINAMSTSVLAEPLSTFSTIAVSSIVSSILYYDSVNSLPGLYIMSTLMDSTFTSFYKPLDVSTNYLGYTHLSTTSLTVFSTFSANIAYILGATVINNLSTINSGISSLSTTISRYNSTVNNTVYSYITGPGISTMNAELSTNTSVTYIDYSHTISSIILPYSNAVNVVNSAPGVSSIFSTAFVYNSTIMSTISSATIYVTTGYLYEKEQVLSTNSTTIYQININIENFISAGITAYNSNATYFNSISSTTINYSTYIYNQAFPGTNILKAGDIYVYLNSLSTSVQSTFLSTLIPFQGSSIYYQALPIISDYSTSLYAKGDITPRWLTRSTIFYSIETEILSSITSSFTISSINVNTASNNEYRLNVQGGTSIQPKISITIADLILPNFEMYNTLYPVPINSKQSLLTHYSTTSFNNGDLSLLRIYNRTAFGYVGINTLTPGYALDIATGDARKPSGTTWLTVSDSRIKETISNPSIQLLIEQISSLRLVSYTWEESYRSTLQLPTNRTIGFLSQEVEKIFTNSVYEKDEYGFSNFKSLDTDQLYKARYGLTQHLLNRISSLQMRVNSLLKES
jgi:hypothetical protein